MAARYTMQQDRFLVAYYPAVGDYCGVHDLGKPAGSADRRVKKLKETGAWDALEALLQAEQRHIREYREALGLPVWDEEEEE